MFRFFLAFRDKLSLFEIVYSDYLSGVSSKKCVNLMILRRSNSTHYTIKYAYGNSRLNKNEKNRILHKKVKDPFFLKF